MKRKLGATGTVMTAVAILLASCSFLPQPESNRPCPPDWQAAVLWTTVRGSDTQLSLLNEAGEVERRDLPFIGFEADPASRSARIGPDVVLASNGNLKRDKTHLVTFSTATCAVTGYEITEPVIFGVGADSNSVYTTNSLNGSAELRRRDRSGNLMAENRIPSVLLSALTPHGESLYALGSEDADSQSILLTLDPETLTERSRVDLRGSEEVIRHAIVKGHRLYYPQTLSGNDTEGTKLGIVDLDTMEQSTVELGAPSPFLIMDTDDYIYLGHTFINSGYRPLTEYRWISRYHLETGKVERFDAGIGIRSMTIRDGILYVLGAVGEGDKEVVKLRTFDLPDLTLRAELAPPKPDGPYYPGALIVP